MIDAQGLAEISQVGAAAHADMLAGIYELTRDGILEGTCAAAQSWSRLQQSNGEPAWRQRRRRGQARQTCANDDDPLGHSCSLPVGSFWEIAVPPT